MEPEQGVGIATVERETGLSKDTLRTWERRYGFPVPRRDEQGVRRYPVAQVQKLRMIQRLLDTGMRPGQVIPRSIAELQRLGAEATTLPEALPSNATDYRRLLQSIKDSDAVGVGSQLRWLLADRGLRGFVIDWLADFNTVVGMAWARGEITVAQEHLYSEQVAIVLRRAVPLRSPEAAKPRALLTTLPGEQHKLGLLMLEALLEQEGASCVPLGTGTPVDDIVHLALDGEVDIVAVSFSRAYSRPLARSGLEALRAALPDRVAIWAGGDGVRRLRNRPPGVAILTDLQSALAALERWRS